MTTIEDKVNLFTKIIYDKIDERNSKVIGDFEKEKELKFKELKEYMDVERAKVLEEAKKKAEIKALELVTLEKTKGQKKILELKQEFITELVLQVKERFIGFAATEEYESYLFELLESCVKGISRGDYIIFLRAEDLKKYRQKVVELFLRYGISVSVQQYESDFVGGFIIQHQGGKYRIDYSFLSKIEENKELIALKYMNA